MNNPEYCISDVYGMVGLVGTDISSRPSISKLTKIQRLLSLNINLWSS